MIHQSPPGCCQGIIFDCDGVLIDSWESTRYYFNRILSALNLPEMTPLQEDFAFIHTIPQTLAEIVPAELKGLAHEESVKITAEDLLPRLQVKPGIKDFLEYLKLKSIRCAVDTNGGHEALGILAGLALLPYFELVVTNQEVSEPKPHPEGIRLILNHWRLRATEVAFIGDSAVDQAAARNAGVSFWAYENPSLEARVHLPDFAAARQILQTSA